MLDVTLTLLAEAPRPLKHRDRVRFHIGTSEIMGRVILLDCDEVQPGEAVFAQLHLEESAIAAPQDRYVLRSYSPIQTIAGGRDPRYLAGQAPAPSSARAGAAHHLTGWHRG
jgi:selenocysteine-specific elongation factor